ncbi:SfnB family sulfur acquisition oxidoreductase [Paracraurococcus lichenis]|uniref:SfnB family sulfur acquisition oxidoreductase n=1 Tax=Paracraurococcus lichenis TaxID=3064888 RepID=A0ABT9E5K1_9PROT|nr:SfnB family sulfur acquisition oxidoreductase [Paracraurococcus sp. LOR1-02]MDO9711446.1 SfnB family sulfur acquisition oxidoreductase [Paracraurococcus sp. LOR1-02]
MNAPVTRPAARRIAGDAEAIETAIVLAAQFAPGAAQRDRDRILPWAEVEAFSASGLWAITVPRSFDGPALSNVTLARVIALIAAADGSLGQIPQNHFAVLEALRLHGTPDQQDFFFRRVLAGDRMGNATAEPGDKRPKDHATSLHRTAGRLRLQGRKLYSTGALFAHWVPVSATDEAGAHVTVFVPRGAPGLTIVDDWSSFGQRTTASGTVIIEDVAVEPLWVLRRAQAGAPVDTGNAVSQLVHTAIDLGIARAAIDDTLHFFRVLAHPARGSGVAMPTDDPLALREIGALTLQYHAAEALVERAGRLVDAAQASTAPTDAAAALIAVVEAKIVTTEIALAATNKLFELAGTQSTLLEHGLDRHWRNARTHTLHDGVRWKYHALGEFVLNGRLCDPWTLGHPYTPTLG